jgi:uncharacterized protein YggE
MSHKNLILFILLLMAVTTNAQTIVVEDKTKKIEVTGSAEMEVVPDEVYVSITLQEYYDKQKIKVDIDRIQKDFLDRCMKAGISKDRIQILSMSGFDQNSWYWRKRKKEQPDLLASTTYTIKFNSPAEIDKLVNTVDDNSTTQMHISKTSHSRIEEFRKDVKIKALQAAKAKAQYLCESIGEKLGNTLYVQEIESGYQPMYKGMASNMAMDVAQSANEGIDFQKILIRYEMRAQFGIQ